MTFQFESIADFFAMGGYGFYVWLSYAITFIAVGALIWQSKREMKQTLRQTKKAVMGEIKLKKSLNQ